MHKANLSETDLNNANEQADLSHTDLSGANLSGAWLEWVESDDDTKWPDHFDPVAAGAEKLVQKPPDEVNVDESKPA